MQKLWNVPFCQIRTVVWDTPFFSENSSPPLSVDILGFPDSLCLCFLFVLFLSFLIPVTPAHFYVPLCTLVPKGD